MVSPVSLHIGEFTLSDSGAKGIRVEVTNTSSVTINSLTADVSVEFTTPLDAPVGAKEYGREIAMVLPDGAPSGPLLPGEKRTYCLLPDWLPDIQALLQMASATKPCIKLTIDGSESRAVSAEWMLNYLAQKFGDLKPKRKFTMTQDRVTHVGNLVGKIFTENKPFKVHAPREVTDDPSVLESNEIVDRLADSKWWLRFSDGAEELLTTPELLVLTRNLIDLRLRFDEAHRNGELKDGRFNPTFTFSVDELMTPQAMKLFFSKLTLEGVPSRIDG